MTMPSASERIMYNAATNQQHGIGGFDTDLCRHEKAGEENKLLKRPTKLEQMYRKEAREERINEIKDNILEKIPEFGRIK